jgi:hypothetical protein
MQDFTVPVIDATLVLLLCRIEPAFLPKMAPAHEDKSGSPWYIAWSGRMVRNNKRKQIEDNRTDCHSAKEKHWDVSIDGFFP